MKQVLPVLAVMALMMLALAEAPAAAKVPDNPLSAELKQPTITWSCVLAGKRMAQGAKACLSTGQGQRLAICGKVLNNSSWLFSGKSCGKTG